MRLSSNWLQADDVVRELSKQIPPGFHVNKADFIVSLAKDRHFKPFGELIHSYSKTKGLD